MEEKRVLENSHHVGDRVTSTKNKYEAKKDFKNKNIDEDIVESEDKYSDGFEEQPLDKEEDSSQISSED